MIKERLIKFTVQESNHGKQYCAVVTKQDNEAMSVGDQVQRLGSGVCRAQVQASVW